MEYRSELTQVYYVGHGESDPQAQIDRLVRMLQTETLDPKFEKYGNFIIPAEEGSGVSLFGNFFTYSCVFRIDTTDQNLIAGMSRLIRENQRSDAYKLAKKELEKPSRWDNLYK